MGVDLRAVSGRGSSLLRADNVDGICVLSHCRSEHLMVIAWEPVVCMHTYDRKQHYVSMKLPSKLRGGMPEGKCV